jgi:multicomponent Na+:H+ antiporter subunit G
MIVKTLASFFMLLGAVFSIIAAIGIVRMPDLFLRMQASAKTGTLGVGCTIIGVAIYFGDLGVTIRSAMVVAFLFLTAPIAAHMIARAGYVTGAKLWEHNLVDDLEGQYDLQAHELRHDEKKTT